ncbi:hypothetical protein BRARA_B03412 [Brassica rapa]|uniref:eRF1/Pelota-like N-terminal domain-containing protein n=1 Tax=Brassica campestris TaxID=3711 RepID=A0A398AM85_BRACM|nr:hypothetical protein BRARA_B03412 [Brassica rapa]
MGDNQQYDKSIEIWKMKKLIKSLEAAKGNGTSMISLIMPPRDHISHVTKLLCDEYGTASNIKSRVNRLYVLGAITSAQQRLKLYNRVPPNGLVLYTGTIVNEEGKEKKVTIDFEPFRPINNTLYLCDNKFHTEAIKEKRHNYLRKTAELATQYFISTSTNQPNVSGLILAGSADFKTKLSQSDMFDPRHRAKILNVVEVQHGGDIGFNEAIKKSSEILANVKFAREKLLIGKYFNEVNQGTGKYVVGVEDTLNALDSGAVETLIVWENLDIYRYVLKNSVTGETVIKHLNKEEEVDSDYAVEDKVLLLEWLANEYRRFGCASPQTRIAMRS